MFKFAVTLAIGLALSPAWQGHESLRDACIQRCVASPTLGDPEMQRQEIVSLEKEAARAILQNSALSSSVFIVTTTRARSRTANR